MDYPIGTTYLSSGKHGNVCTVEDVYKTYNSAGELVKTSYVTSHAFLGYMVKEVDVCSVTIARGIDRLKGR